MNQSNLSNLPTIDYDSILAKLSHFFTTTDFNALFISFLASLTYVKFISTILTLLFAIGIFYSTMRLKQIRHKEHFIYGVRPQVEEKAIANTEMNKKWERVAAHISSKNPNDWKIAIIEADIILGDILDSMGYQGESIGEKLKRVAKGDLTTLDKAWEAHKIRNAIAHQGSSFLLNERDAKQAIDDYQAVFTEFEAKG
ncbi:MAG: hypothetical protein EXS50_02220 [Candidatus Taylorbacteria bacterium]|nr:hypothetical protein [Candidatus Taylorbacteria bacterium]